MRLRHLGHGIASAWLGILGAYACGSGDSTGDLTADTTPDGSTSSDGGGGTTDTTDGGPSISDTTPFFKSGTRLRARKVTGGGLPVFETFVDSERNGVACAFEPTSEGDGQMRCLPSAAQFAYTDATCTTKVLLLDDCQKKSIRYGVGRGASTALCSGITPVVEVREIGAEMPGATTIWLSDGTGGCNSLPISPNQKVYAVGAPLPMSSFVGGKKSLESPKPSIQRPRIKGDDGSEIAIEELVDTSRDAGCTAQRVGPPGPAPATMPAVCAPSPLAFSDPGSFFSDPGCTIGAARTPIPPDCPAPRSVLKRLVADGGGTCGGNDGAEVVQLGKEITGYTGSPAACTPKAGERPRLFELGAPIASSSLPNLTYGPLGTGRIRPRANAIDGVQLGAATVWDDTLKDSCTPTDFVDGKTFCVPPGVITNAPTNTFKDAACTEAVLITLPCNATKYVLSGSLTCDASALSTMVIPLGPEETLGQYWDNISGTCTPVTPLAPVTVRAHLTPTTASAVFAEVERTTE